MRVVVREQLVGERRQAEEEVLLLGPFRLGAVLRAELAVDQLLLAVELLAGRAVEPGVGALEEMTAVAQDGHELLHERLVLGIGRADEEVVARLQPAREVTEALGDRVGPRLRLEPGRGGSLRHLGAVLVRAREEEGVLATLARMPARDVRGDRGVGVPEVRLGVHVVDRSGDVVGAHCLDGIIGVGSRPLFGDGRLVQRPARAGP